MSREYSQLNSVRQDRVPERPMNDSVRRHVPVYPRAAGHVGWGHEMTRLASFVGWPSTHPCSPIKLAKNGFYYTGIEDEVVCHNCGLTIRHWGPEQELFEVHFRQSPRCAFFSSHEERNTDDSSPLLTRPADTDSRPQDADLIQSSPQVTSTVSVDTEPEISSDTVTYDIGTGALSTAGRDQTAATSAREASLALFSRGRNQTASAVFENGYSLAFYFEGRNQTASTSAGDSSPALYFEGRDQIGVSSQESSQALNSMGRDHTAAATDAWSLSNSTVEAGFNPPSTGSYFAGIGHVTRGIETNDREPFAVETDVIDLQAERFRREVGVNLRRGRVRSRDIRSRDVRHLTQSDPPCDGSPDYELYDV